MDICIATDNNYSTLVAVLISSILDKTHNPTDINIHVFEYKVDETKKEKIKLLCKKYNANVYFYHIEKYINEIKGKVDNAWANNNSYVAYARLYMADLLPDTIKKFIYLDCDTLVLSDLSEIMNIELGNNVIAEVKDVLPYTYKKWMGFENGDYFNSGVSVINAEIWRKQNYTKKFFEYCNKHQKDLFPDQDAISVLLKDKIYILHPKYCVFYPEFEWSPKIMIKGYLGTEETYYTRNELKEAADSPVIIHFTDSVIGRPWQSNNINKHADLWLKYYNALPKELQTSMKKKIISWKTVIYRILYVILPDWIFSRIYYARRNSDLKMRMEAIDK